MRILSGIQPSGTLHLGNYFGMMKPAIELQEKGEALYFIADLHALTTVHNAAALSANIRDVAVDFLACGLDPKKALLFRQSHVPAVTELSWVLSTLTPMGLLERAHSYKDKLAKGIAPSHGLFAYPVLMAADILIYDSEVVPVGKDQKQHIEITRDLVIKFNETYGETLKLPEPSIQERTAVVPGLDGEKMSKSYGNTIGMFEEEKPMRKKIMGLITDSTPVEEPKSTENSTILGLYKLVASESDYTQMEADFRAGGFGYGDFKKRLFGAVWEYFAPMRQRRTEILADPGFVDSVLRDSAEKANTIANGVMARVRKAVGL
jgi:tryptophanyl-tRNA synthetase